MAYIYRAKETETEERLLGEIVTTRCSILVLLLIFSPHDARTNPHIVPMTVRRADDSGN